MPNENEPDRAKLSEQEAKNNIDAIEAVEANEHAARGNVHSEQEPASDQKAPPPLPI